MKRQKPAKKADVAQKPSKKSTEGSRPQAGGKVDVEAQQKDNRTSGSAEEGVLHLDSDTDSDREENDAVAKLASKIDDGEETIVNKSKSFEPGQDVGRIPSVSKELVQNAQKPTGEPGVIYIGRIPHGFYEHEMRQYLSQFGPVTRVRLSRNKKTGASKHFAFVEFEESSTAEIVAKTMDNYLLFGHILKCKTIPKGQVHEDLFKGANRRFKSVPRNKMERYSLQKPLSETAWKSKVSKEKSKRARQAAKLKDIGYDFDAPDLKDIPPPQNVVNGIEGGKEVVAATEAQGETSKSEPQAETSNGMASDGPPTAKDLTPVKKTKETKGGKAAKGKGKRAKA